MTVWDRLSRHFEMPEESSESGFFEHLPRWQFGGQPVWLLDVNCAYKEFDILLDARGKTPAIVFDGTPSQSEQQNERAKSVRWLASQRHQPEAQWIRGNTSSHGRARLTQLPPAFYSQNCARLQEIKQLFVYTMQERFSPPIRPVCIDNLIQLPPQTSLALFWSAVILSGAWSLTSWGWNKYQRSLPMDVVSRLLDDIPIRAMMDCACQSKAVSMLLASLLFWTSYLFVDGGALIVLAFAQVVTGVIWVAATLLTMMCLCRGWGISRSALTEGELGSTMLFVSL
eukprot:Gregarina_sp_Poly_1__3656@NODE_2078_length_2726_cov_26_942460_g1340_i0_p1_GENE_NODE_2078_length_2726_cov_26_942460_g1340_i0NODE_2078_length_2726_cov_26_942460_g1340_i0_p1_ORF_typecomplete_len284_score28_91CcmB/PF03379_13/1_4e02CcmB/PF03379_13/0_097_NODE_2078_length_2726_cov_26_942460_g1340_i0146997